MLKELRLIMQDIHETQNLAETLHTIAKRICKVLETQTCSIFLFDHRSSEFILIATDGSNQQAIGKVGMPLEKGLLGLIAAQRQAINIDDAPSHPSFKQIPLFFEDHLKAFLGVPIQHHHQLLGVLTVQQEEQRRFSEEDEAFLLTISAQLASHIDLAKTYETICDAKHVIRKKSIIYRGIPSVPAIGIGEAVIIYSDIDLNNIPSRSITGEEITKEITLFKEALKATQAEITKLSENLIAKLPAEEQALFDAYLKILDSQTLTNDVIEKITNGMWAPKALSQTINQYISKFEVTENEYFRERISDIKDLGHRILYRLQPKKREQLNYPEQTVLIGEEVTASDLAEVPEGRLVGIVSAHGSKNSHVAILARAMGVATVMGINDLPISGAETKPVIVDGYFGRVYISPKKKVIDAFLSLINEERELNTELDKIRKLPAQTKDAHHVAMFVSLGLASDISHSLMIDAEGVGLYRTEVPFMIRDRFPSAEEQRIIYRQLLTVFSPRPVVMRTLDIGGDKTLPYFPIQEENPF